jgi:hypothetical protein
MNLLFDGWSVLVLDKGSVFVFLISLLGLGFFGYDYFFDLIDHGPTLRFFTRFAVGTLLLTWLSLALVLFGRLWLPVLSIGSVLVPIVCLIYMIWILWKRGRVLFGNANIFTIISVGCLSFLVFLFRLAFIKKIIFPPYDDSPDHFMVIRDLLSAADPGRSIFYVLRNGGERYYHVGFHAIAAWLVSASHIDPAVAMSLLGQLYIFISAISIFYLTFVLTENLYAGFVAGVFAALAWTMPGFAANWGKYPAFSGLALLPMWLGLLFIYLRKPKKRLVSIVFIILIFIGLAAIHTRLIICFAVIGVAYFVGLKLKINSLSAIPQFLTVFFAALLIPFLFLNQIQIFYSNYSYFAIGLTALLLPFSCLRYPKIVFGISFSMIGIWLAANIQVFFGLYGTSWLDAPFVEILLYIPFSIISGLGFSGLLEKTEKYQLFLKFTVVIPIIILIFGFKSLNSFYPDHCCNYVTASDIKAISWIKANTPLDSVVWVSGFKPHNYMIGTDAGVWVLAMTGRNTNKLQYDFNWQSPASKGKICQSGLNDVYVYKGGLDYSFDESAIARENWLKISFLDGQNKIYKVSCNRQP